MNASTNDSTALRYATLTTLALLACVLLARPRILTETASSLPALNHTGTTVTSPSVSPANAASLPVDPRPGQADVALAHSNPLPEAAPLPSQSDLPPRPDSPRTTGFSETDRSFLQTAATVDAQKYQISSQLLSHLIYPEVREYACAIIDGHGAVNAELTDLAARKGVVLPTPEQISLPKPKRDNGSLDRRYVNLMTEGNKEVIEIYEQATRSADPEVAAFARKMLPVLQNHLNTARNLEKAAE